MSNEGCQEENAPDNKVHIFGILFSRSVRSSFTSLCLAPCDETAVETDEEKFTEEDAEPILVRVQYQLNELRSFCRRNYKLGDILEIKVTRIQEVRDSVDTAGKKPRIIVSVHSIGDANKNIIAPNRVNKILLSNSSIFRT